MSQGAIHKKAGSNLIALLAFPEIKKIFTFIFLFKANLIKMKKVSVSNYLKSFNRKMPSAFLLGKIRDYFDMTVTFLVTVV
jgi:hypothetical protein